MSCGDARIPAEPEVVVQRGYRVAADRTTSVKNASQSASVRSARLPGGERSALPRYRTASLRITVDMNPSTLGACRR